MRDNLHFLWSVDRARRLDAEMGIDLRRWRVWSADDGEDDPEDATEKEDTGSPDEAEKTDSPMIPKTRFDEVNKKRKDAEAELAMLHKAERDRLEAEAIQKGEYEKVIESMKPKADRADALEATLQEYLDLELADVPEDMQDLIPNGDVKDKLTWIRQAKARGLFTPESAPETDAGARGDTRTKVKLTPLEEQMAREYNMTDEEYIKFKRTSDGS